MNSEFLSHENEQQLLEMQTPPRTVVTLLVYDLTRMLEVYCEESCPLP